ncbi:hypothetical protein NONI108955_41860 [Nocardia ninae]|uniref:Uncharacterized protein n=1 Tax=Nocardia ninae NBRC 108245 TaxID=1210091 RepID=A0A511MT03_9NOCA|nr:hypothetical protein [Nocardia ninae]GEM43712.1 hypothetical protein NN4_82310 [Nocardia ninae NBRC 108245]
MTEVVGAKIVAEHWPLSGPHSEESLASATEAIDELVRYLAHATIANQAAEALPFAPDGYIVISRLATAAHAQDQVLRQLADWADNHLAADPNLRHDTEPADRASVTALEASAYLNDAANKAGELGRALARAQGLLGHLYHDQDNE